ncbi:hypothetical protein BGW80DRAFT_630096 [Lactifluus volemus]|nr:hypothetical protein BGW80DRAFT_630096 [Lactifluus volemus]
MRRHFRYIVSVTAPHKYPPVTFLPPRRHLYSWSRELSIICSLEVDQIMSTLPPIPPNIEELAAPLLLGTIWNWALYGALVVQLYVYSYNFPRDKKLIKILVYGVFLLETLQTALSGADIYYWFVSGFGNMDHLTSPYASAFDVPIIGAVVSLTVQFFFAYRIWVLGKKESWWLSLLICLCSFVDASAAFAGGTYTHVRGKFVRGQMLKILALTWLIGNTVSDLLITSAMLYHLAERKARDGQYSSHAIISIVRLTIETNVVTTTVSIIALLMVAIFPEKNWYVCPTAILGKLYSNTLLVSFNNRVSIRDGVGNQSGVIRSGGGSFPSNTVPSDDAHILLVDIKKTVEESPMDSKAQERVINIK